MQNVYTVSWVNAYVKNMISQDFMLQSLNVKGEASNVKYHSSGHLYFTLKDEKGAIPCVMFARDRQGLTFPMKEGDQIVVTGSMDVYERDGRYQIYAKKISLAGIGDLYVKFEELKRKLEDMGMFDEMYKQPIPRYIKRLGVVTAPTGAAVRDIISITKRRNPSVEIILYPAIVQGEHAPASIVNGIRCMSQMDVDTIIVGRGGGSIEDLWAFNEESVAQAIFDCEIPIISAVGHETDTTIADYVADLRAATPSAAAELAIFDVSVIQNQLLAYANQLGQGVQRRISKCRAQLQLQEQTLRRLSPENRLKQQRMRLMHTEEQLEQLIDKKLTACKHRLALHAGRMDALSPLKKMCSGYAYVQNEQHKAIKSTKDVTIDEMVRFYVQDGSMEAKIVSISHKD